ncbi:MAG TPA: branched-chain amino acid ABC transporter permease [Sumerlaeia bacterium]|nr:branched-chain amino acid ABC transporter permease [Sumerlaeia bacterium]
MKELLQTILDGLAEGSLYAMIALGYTLVYGIVKLINFAHGEFFMIGAYIGLFILATPASATSSPWLFALVLALAFGASVCGASLLAVATERIAYRPIRGYDRIVALLTAIGVSFLLQNLARLAFSPNPRSYAVPGNDPDACWGAFLRWYHAYAHPLGFELQNAKLLILIIAAVTLAFLYTLVMRTRFGKAMRATSQDLETAKLMGIDTDAVIARTFALGGAFAGLAGMLTGMLRIVEPMMGFMPGLKAFVAAVVGGIGSIPGAVLGGLVIGLAENLAVFANLDSAYKDAVAFAILVLILMFRPGGILGVLRREKV